MPNLQEVIQNADLPSLKKMIQEGIQVNKPCANSLLPLRIAVDALFQNSNDRSDERVQIVETLLEVGANPNFTFENGQSLLHRLCQEGFQAKWQLHFDFGEKCEKKQALALRVISKVLQQKINLEAVDGDGHTPLSKSLEYQNTAAAHLLLAAGANIKIELPGKRNIFHLACAAGDKLFIERLLPSKQLDINAHDQRGFTPLDEVTNPELILYLLQRGAVGNQRNLLDWFVIAQAEKHNGLMDYLFEHGLAKFSCTHCPSPLWRTHDLVLTERLLTAGCPPDIDSLAAQIATNQNNDPVTLEFIALYRRFNLDCRLPTGLAMRGTLLHLVIHQSIPVLQTIIKAGVPLDAIDQQGKTALHLAAISNLVVAIQLLLECGASPTIPDASGKLPSEHLSQYARHEKTPTETFKSVLLTLLKTYPKDRPISNSDDLIFLSVHHDCREALILMQQRGINIFKGKVNVFFVAITATHTELLGWLIQEAKDKPEASQLKVDGMHYAATVHNPEYLQMFIVQGQVNINALHSDGSTILSAFMRFLENILRENDKASDEEKKKQTVKFQQAKATLTFLLENKVNINQPNKEGNTLIRELLYEHAGARYWVCICILLRHRAELPEELMDLLQLIRIAAEYNDLTAIKYILDNSKRPYYRNILLAHAATIGIGRNNLELLKQLQQLGLDLRKPYYFLEYEGLKKQYLLDHVIQRRYTVGSNTADEDARKKSFQIFLQYFISLNIDVLYPLSFHRTPILHMAASDGFNDIVMTLLQPQYGFHIDLKAAEDEHLTPLQIAVFKNNVALAKLLLTAGANPHVLTKDGKTLLHIACENGYIAMVELLLTTKIDILAKISVNYLFTSMELTAIHYASQYKDVAVAQQLVTILLPYWPQIDSILFATAIQKHFDEKLLKAMLQKIPRNLLTLNKFLYVAIKANNLMACTIFVARMS